MVFLLRTPEGHTEYAWRGPDLELLRHLPSPARRTPHGVAWSTPDAIHLDGRPPLAPPPGQVLDLLPHPMGLFAAGRTDAGPAVWHYRAAWHPLPVPAHTVRPGKAVDFLFATDRHLLGVDDIALPLYLLRWDLRTLAPLPAIELPLHGTYEHIHHAALADGRMALVSTTCNRGRWHAHAWTLHAGWAQAAHWDLGRLRDPSTRLSVALVGDQLVLAHPELGLTAMRPGSAPRVLHPRPAHGLTAVGGGVWWLSDQGPRFCPADHPGPPLPSTDDFDFDIPAFYRRF